ncbi:hypothetical protein [Flavilitoribacter nigricans]|uniref:Uncharacterized protein n=1 Tax=Flavilitoribacter nigricans (strain ATCC 23147 / DSM 23189 / NBRC 102662 / NCIMB 1420 / SS-2) TaxID=1122177 RepID=A0A2D0N313_FLAN2|nr:hypothetical protein [Flavilitoribacter nigricans]PHN02529.1 hypothetical protein CRP01_31630 [Flavilitoribacter nigricans DSM 23189 = NBRC 102662]
MSDKLKQERKDLEISAGLLAGYILAGTVNMLVFDKTWKEAFSEKELILGFVGIAISIFIISRLKRKQKDQAV